MSAPKVDVLAWFDDYIRRCGAYDDGTPIRAAVVELIEAAKEAKRAYWLARNSAAGLTNYCEESASARRCERELSEAESIWHSAGLDAALANIGPQS